jgi:hypothetical protein
VSASITGGFSSGRMNTKMIGPALSWQSFHEQYSEKEIQDEIVYKIVGVKFSGETTMLFSDVSSGQHLSTIDATEFPYLQVEFNTTDELNLTSPQLNHWIVYYTPVPEGLVTYLGPRSQQIVSEGGVWDGLYGFINIGDRNFSDSLMVRYETYNHQTTTNDVNTIRIKAPAVGDTTSFTINIDTQGKKGLNDIGVYVNPRIAPEQYYDNNVITLIKHVNVESDFLRPVLDVTVDGRHLVEGDFVSTNPLITVKVWDENKNFIKESVDGMRIFLTYPCDDFECDPVAIDLSSDMIKWFPATSTSDFRIEFRPASLPDGYYILTVEGEDAQGNASGVEPYQVGFAVQAESTVNIMPPYPNPSSADVKFNVVISGEIIPSEVFLEVVDVNGKRIREFSTDHVHIGTNQWSWDGTDSAGSNVTPGIYIYKVFFELDGKKFQKNCKVVIVR